MPASSELPPLALYVHLPWCASKCPYCDFNSHAQHGALAEDDYIEALFADLEHDLALTGGRHLSSIFIGGGTPSLFSADAIARLLTGVRRRVALAPGCEITLEANPDSADAARFAGYREAGVNRLSLGIQSFDDAALERLRRAHDAKQARHACDAARAAGFDNFNLDLMFGLPQQTPEQGLDDVRRAIEARPSHISYYQLTIEPNTLFYKFPPSLPRHDDICSLQEAAMLMLHENGYPRYEVSAFGKTPCRHNLNYWQFGDYLGIGAGAHGKLSVGLPDEVVRVRKVRMPQTYIERARCGKSRAGRRLLDRDSLIFEFLLNALRLTDGVAPELFRRHTGLPGGFLEARIAAAGLVEQGLVVWDGGRVKTTDKGYLFLDEILENCLPSPLGFDGGIFGAGVTYAQAD